MRSCITSGKSWSHVKPLATRRKASWVSRQTRRNSHLDSLVPKDNRTGHNSRDRDNALFRRTSAKRRPEKQTEINAPMAMDESGGPWRKRLPGNKTREMLECWERFAGRGDRKRRRESQEDDRSIQPGIQDRSPSMNRSLANAKTRHDRDTVTPSRRRFYADRATSVGELPLPAHSPLRWPLDAVEATDRPRFEAGARPFR